MKFGRVVEGVAQGRERHAGIPTGLKGKSRRSTAGFNASVLRPSGAVRWLQASSSTRSDSSVRCPDPSTPPLLANKALSADSSQILRSFDHVPSWTWLSFERARCQ